MANKWHSIDRRIYGEGDSTAPFAEASPEHAEQIVREHNERPGLVAAARFTHFRCQSCGYNGTISEDEIATHRSRCATGITEPARAALSTQEPNGEQK